MVVVVCDTFLTLICPCPLPVKTLKLLIKKGVCLSNDEGEKALVACLKSKLTRAPRVCQMLIKNGAGSKSNTAVSKIDLALKQCDPEMMPHKSQDVAKEWQMVVQELIDHGYAASTMTLTHTISGDTKNYDAFLKILEKGYEVKGSNLLSLVIKSFSTKDFERLDGSYVKENTDVIKKLIEKGAELVVDEYGKNALFYAVQVGAWETVELLLNSFDVDINHASYTGQTIFYGAPREAVGFFQKFRGQFTTKTWEQYFALSVNV